MDRQPSFRDDLYSDIKPSYTDSLMHHGIKGMHWGIRRYQNPDGSLTNAGKSRQKQNNKNRLKTAAKVAGVATAIGLAGAGAYAVSKSGNLTGGVYNVQNAPRSGFPVLAQRDTDILDTADKVNPNAVTGDPKYLLNCTHCSMAFDLRRRGYDVEAGPGNVHTEGFIKKAYPGAEHHDIPGLHINGMPTAKNRDLSIKNIRDNLKAWKKVMQKASNDPEGFAKDQETMMNSIIKTCESMGPGARGAINLTLANGMGHCIAFECDKKGNAQIVDTQLIGTVTGQITMGGAFGKKESAYVDTFLKGSIMPYIPCSVTRYDNAEPDFKYLKKKKAIIPRKDNTSTSKKRKIDPTKSMLW